MSRKGERRGGVVVVFVADMTYTTVGIETSPLIVSPSTVTRGNNCLYQSRKICEGAIEE